MVASFLALAKSMYYALSARANKIFQKPTVFVFSESQSRDQLMQKAYSKHKAIYRSCRGRYKQQLFCCFCLFKSLMHKSSKEEQRECTRRVACLK